mgnify:CR=1 FL=1
MHTHRTSPRAPTGRCQAPVSSGLAGTRVTVVLGHCPFAASVTDDRVVCDLHRGIAEGVAAASRTATVTAFETAPPHEGGCRLFITIDPTPGKACGDHVSLRDPG